MTKKPETRGNANHEEVRHDWRKFDGAHDLIPTEMYLTIAIRTVPYDHITALRKNCLLACCLVRPACQGSVESTRACFTEFLIEARVETHKTTVATTSSIKHQASRAAALLLVLYVSRLSLSATQRQLK